MWHTGATPWLCPDVCRMRRGDLCFFEPVLLAPCRNVEKELPMIFGKGNERAPALTMKTNPQRHLICDCSSELNAWLSV